MIGNKATNRKTQAMAATVLMAATLACTQPALANNSGKADACGEVIINAPLAVVWRAVHEDRQNDPDLAYSKVIHHTSNQDTVEQKFIGLPLLGSAIAITQQLEVPFHRIDYTLVHSDKFKDLRGSWQLFPINDGKGTRLSLNSFLDVGVPFSGFFIRNATQRKINRRLEHVKQLAEREEANIAHNTAEHSL
jgi:hypothetical protein